MLRNPLKDGDLRRYSSPSKDDEVTSREGVEFFLFVQSTLTWFTMVITKHYHHMKYRIDAYFKNGTVRQGTILLDNIDAAIEKAKQVASHYHCYTRIARVTV